jgi:hypothetical protein
MQEKHKKHEKAQIAHCTAPSQQLPACLPPPPPVHLPTHPAAPGALCPAHADFFVWLLVLFFLLTRTVHKMRAGLVGMLAAVSVLLMDTANTYLYFNDLPSPGGDSEWPWNTSAAPQAAHSRIEHHHPLLSLLNRMVALGLVAALACAAAPPS